MHNKVTIQKRTIRIFEHSTSISLESVFWDYLKIIASKENKTITELIESIDLQRVGNLSSTIRVFVFKYFIKDEYENNN